MPDKKGSKHQVLNKATNLPAKQSAPLLGIEPLLDDRDLEEITGKARSSWQKARLNGTGPRFVRLGRLVRYRRSDFEEWLAARPSLRSTSDAAAS